MHDISAPPASWRSMFIRLRPCMTMSTLHPLPHSPEMQNLYCLQAHLETLWEAAAIKAARLLNNLEYLAGMRVATKVVTQPSVLTGPFFARASLRKLTARLTHWSVFLPTLAFFYSPWDNATQGVCLSVYVGYSPFDADYSPFDVFCISHVTIHRTRVCMCVSFYRRRGWLPRAEGAASLRGGIPRPAPRVIAFAAAGCSAIPQGSARVMTFKRQML